MATTDKRELEVTEKKPIEASGGEPTRQGITYTPQVDIVEDPNAITVYADLPGVKRDDLVIDVREGVLWLTATVGAHPDHWQPVHREYQEGGYERRFSLGDRIDTEKISAKLENGVLALVLPKAEAQKPRKISIA
ncbi:MAG: Hsp20/alpha crystallin family protein [Deltaproteobacteria bacterium]|nr:Hsp20/alpha crystallin family protein [Deltaproteobacteria bacterium]